MDCFFDKETNNLAIIANPFSFFKKDARSFGSTPRISSEYVLVVVEQLAIILLTIGIAWINCGATSSICLLIMLRRTSELSFLETLKRSVKIFLKGDKGSEDSGEHLDLITLRLCDSALGIELASHIPPVGLAFLLGQPF